MRKKYMGIAGGLVAVTAAVVAITVFVAPSVSARGPVGAPVHQGAANHTISVGGHGEVQVSPDRATLNLAVETRGNDAQAAVSDNATKMNAVVAAVQAHGVPTNHIQTTNLSIYYDTEHNVYVVSHQVTVHIDNVDRVGAILDAAVQAGANNSWGVDFGLKDPSASRAQALAAAVTDARSRANSMAVALGVSISGVGSASEASYAVSPMPYTPGRVAATQSTPVQTGDLTVTADVNVVYTFG